MENHSHDKPNMFIDQIVLKVEDIERSIEFYTRIMGFYHIERDGKEAKLTSDRINPIITIILGA